MPCWAVELISRDTARTAVFKASSVIVSVIICGGVWLEVYMDILPRDLGFEGTLGCEGHIAVDADSVR